MSVSPPCRLIGLSTQERAALRLILERLDHLAQQIQAARREIGRQ